MMSRSIIIFLICAVIFLTASLAVTPVVVPQIEGMWRFKVVVTSASDNKPNLDSWTQRLIIKQKGTELKLYSLTQTITAEEYPYFQGYIRKDSVIIEKTECDGALVERYTLKLSKDKKSMTGTYYYKEAEDEPEIINTGTVEVVRIK